MLALRVDQDAGSVYWRKRWVTAEALVAYPVVYPYPIERR